LRGVCDDILGLIDQHLLPRVNDIKDKDGEYAECKRKMYWNKMKGDYYRYMAEFEKDGRKLEVQEKALNSYQLALKDGEGLKPTDPVLLGLALNFSVFFYEILGEKDKAVEMCKKYFDQAIPLIDQLQGTDYKDTTLILQLIRDNLALCLYFFFYLFSYRKFWEHFFFDFRNQKYN